MVSLPRTQLPEGSNAPSICESGSPHPNTCRSLGTESRGAARGSGGIVLPALHCGRPVCLELSCCSDGAFQPGESPFSNATSPLPGLVQILPSQYHEADSFSVKAMAISRNVPVFKSYSGALINQCTIFFI